MLIRAVNALKSLRFTAINLSKAKSERINALRKQYDAILEEDKKRKDRNDYIMGWLDRVRMSPTLPSAIQERSANSLQIPVQHQPRYTHKYQPNQHVANVKNPFNENLDESVILNAVNQKYILIPKRSPEYKNDNTFNYEKIPSINNDIDWKRKYDILNDLKLDEKEENRISDNRESIDISIKDIAKFETENKKIAQNKASAFHFNNPSQEGTLYKHNTSKQNGEYKLDEKNYGFYEDSKQRDLGIKNNDSEAKLLQDNSEKGNMGQLNIQQCQLPTQNINKKISFDNDIQEQTKSTSVKEIEVSGELTGISSLQINENNNKIVENALAKQFKAEPHADELVSDKISRISTVVDSVIATNDVVSSQHDSSFGEISETNDVTQYNTLSAPQQTEMNKDIGDQFHDTNKHSSDIEISENYSEREPAINPTCSETIDNAMDDQSQIEEFEAEQKELFYSEDQNMNYTNDEEQVTNNDNYDNNEHSYYEATKEDQNNYATDLNEYEETTEQYDPRYQVQYGEPDDEAQLHTQYPTDDYSKNDSEDYKQQQYYENYEGQQIDDTMGREQQHYDNSAYEEQQENIEVSYAQDYAEEIPPQDETLENIVDNQLNIEDGYGPATAAVSNNEESSTPENILAST